MLYNTGADTTLAAVRIFSVDEIRAATALLQSIDAARLDALARVQANAPARELVIVPGKSATAGAGLTEDEAVEHVKAGGDVIARDKSIAKRIAQRAGSGAPEWDPPHGPGQKPHYHPTGPNGERVGGHVLY